MTDITELDGPRAGRAPGEDARELIILLHGLGADGNDLIGLAPALIRSLPEAAFVSPHAPFPCDMAPMGRQWFSLQDRDDEALLAGVRTAVPSLNAFIDRELERYGLTDDRLALIAFSQGTMMALHVGLRRAKPCAVVLGYSGALIAPALLPAEVTSRPPILLVHGDIDEVVSPTAMAAAQEALEANDVPVHCELRPGLGHGIDTDGIGLGMAMLERFLYPDRDNGAATESMETGA